MPAMRKGQRIIVLCEGDTEELATRYFLLRQWKADGLGSVGLHAINLNGRVQDTGVKARLYLEEPDILAAFTLLDLHGMDRVVHHACDELDAKVQRVRQWLRGQVNHPRIDDFFPHVCVHQTEAWILAEGSALAERLSDHGIKPDPDAEVKNFQRPPSKRINELFLTRRSADRYQKIRDGRPLFAAMKFEPVYSSCRYFRAFYDDLRAAGRRSEVRATELNFQ